MWPAKIELFGIMYSPTDYVEAVEAIAEAAKSEQGGIVSCHAAHATVTFSDSHELREVVNSFQMVTPDGHPVRWALNWAYGLKLRDRVYGPELMLRLCDRAARDGLRIYLYGGHDDVLDKLRQQLSRRFPRLQIVGAYSPPFRDLTEQERSDTIARINDSGAQIVFIGLGCPKQDLFAYENRDAIQAVQICVGAAFDFHAGVKRMAPKWMQRNGLEWCFRLSQEPSRLWKRYLVTNTSFIWRLIPFVLRKRLRVGDKRSEG